MLFGGVQVIYLVLVRVIHRTDSFTSLCFVSKVYFLFSLFTIGKKSGFLYVGACKSLYYLCKTGVL